MRERLKRIILLALQACSGMPMPEAALLSAAQNRERATDADVSEALKDVEAAGYVQGSTDDLTGRSWTLTEKGVHKARQLR